MEYTLIVLLLLSGHTIGAQSATLLTDQVFDIEPVKNYWGTTIDVDESESLWYSFQAYRADDTEIVSQLSVFDEIDNLQYKKDILSQSGLKFFSTIQTSHDLDSSIIRFGPSVYKDDSSERSMAYVEYDLATETITKSYEWPNTISLGTGNPYYDVCPDCSVIFNDTLYVFDWLTTLDGSDSNYVADLFVIDLRDGEIVRHFEYDNESQGQFNWFNPKNGVFYEDGFLYGGEGLDLQRLNTVTGRMDTSETRRLYQGFSNLEIFLPGFAEYRSFFFPQENYYYWQSSQTYHVTVGDTTLWLNPEASGMALTKINAKTLEIVDSIHFLREDNTFPFDGPAINIFPFKTSSFRNNICAQGDFLYGLADNFQSQLPRVAVWKVDTASFSVVWERYYDLPFSGAFGHSVSPQPNGAILINGVSRGALDQPWFYRLDADGNPLQVSSSFEIATRPVLNLNVFPNPTSQQLNLQLLEHEATTAITKVSLVNNTGQVVQEIDRGALIGAASSESLTIDVSALPAGTYFVRIALSDGEWLAKPVVVQR